MAAALAASLVGAGCGGPEAPGRRGRYLDLLTAAPEARVELPGGGAGKFGRHLRLARVVSGGDSRSCVYLHAPGSATFRIDAPPHATLSGAAGVGDEVVSHMEPVEARIELSRPGKPDETLWSTRFEPPTPGFRPFTVPIPEGPMELRFRVQGLAAVRLVHPPNVLGDGVGFSTPHIVSAGVPWTPPPAAPDSIVLLSLDTLRVSELGAFGDGGCLTPRLDRILRRGELYGDATSPSNWTLPAHMSLFTSEPPDAHGVSPTSPLAPALQTLPLVLQQRGYHTAGFAADIGWLAARHGFARGFDRYQLSLEPSQLRIRRVRQHLEGVAGRKLFLFVHLFDAHGDTSTHPYEASPEGRALAGAALDEQPSCEPAPCIGPEVLRRAEGGPRYAPHEETAMRLMYRAGLADLDAAVGQLAAELDGVGLGDATMAIVSDHGEEFGDHGRYLHLQLYPEVTRALLSLSGPGCTPGLRRGTASLVDVAPTLLALHGIPSPPTFTGTALHASEPALSWSSTESGHRVIRTDGAAVWRLPDGTLQRFTLDEDPGESVPASVAADDPLASELLRRMKDHAARAGALGPQAPARPAPPEDAAHLRALGYVQ